MARKKDTDYLKEEGIEIASMASDIEEAGEDSKVEESQTEIPAVEPAPAAEKELKSVEEKPVIYSKSEFQELGISVNRAIFLVVKNDDPETINFVPENVLATVEVNPDLTFPGGGLTLVFNTFNCLPGFVLLDPVPYLFALWMVFDDKENFYFVQYDDGKVFSVKGDTILTLR